MTSANVAKAWEEFGWEAQFDLEDIVKDEIAYPTKPEEIT